VGCPSSGRPCLPRAAWPIRNTATSRRHGSRSHDNGVRDDESDETDGVAGEAVQVQTGQAHEEQQPRGNGGGTPPCPLQMGTCTFRNIESCQNPRGRNLGQVATNEYMDIDLATPAFSLEILAFLTASQKSGLGVCF